MSRINYKKIFGNELPLNLIGCALYRINKTAKRSRDYQKEYYMKYLDTRNLLYKHLSLQSKEKKENLYFLKDRVIYLLNRYYQIKPVEIHTFSNSYSYFLLYRIGHFEFHIPVREYLEILQEKYDIPYRDTSLSDISSEIKYKVLSEWRSLKLLNKFIKMIECFRDLSEFYTK
jgi:hypothetical protein